LALLSAGYQDRVVGAGVLERVESLTGAVPVTVGVVAGASGVVDVEGMIDCSGVGVDGGVVVPPGTVDAGIAAVAWGAVHLPVVP
jgi:hypothetical protein